MFSIVVCNRSIPLAPLEESAPASLSRILKIERQGKESDASANEAENRIPGMILEEKTMFELLKATMARIFYYDNVEKRNCAIAGLEYHAILFRITSSSNGAWFHAEIVQEDQFSAAAANE
jgi:hypothetical protein